MTSWFSFGPVPSWVLLSWLGAFWFQFFLASSCVAVAVWHSLVLWQSSHSCGCGILAFRLRDPGLVWLCGCAAVVVWHFGCVALWYSNRLWLSGCGDCCCGCGILVLVLCLAHSCCGTVVESSELCVAFLVWHSGESSVVWLW